MKDALHPKSFWPQGGSFLEWKALLACLQYLERWVVANHIILSGRSTKITLPSFKAIFRDPQQSLSTDIVLLHVKTHYLNRPKPPQGAAGNQKKHAQGNHHKGIVTERTGGVFCVLLVISYIPDPGNQIPPPCFGGGGENMKFWPFICMISPVRGGKPVGERPAGAVYSSKTWTLTPPKMCSFAQMHKGQ